eukprot:515788_1
MFNLTPRLNKGPVKIELIDQTAYVITEKISGNSAGETYCVMYWPSSYIGSINKGKLKVTSTFDVWNREQTIDKSLASANCRHYKRAIASCQDRSSIPQHKILYPWVDGQTLYDYVINNNPNDDIILETISQICEHLVDASGCEIYHRDLCPKNIIINDKNGINIYVIDHTSAICESLFNKDELISMSDNCLNKPLYAAPEAIKQCYGKNRKFGNTIDVFSLSMILWFMCNMEHPSRDATTNAAPPELNSSNEFLNSIYADMSSSTPSDRPTVDQLMQTIGEHTGKATISSTNNINECHGVSHSNTNSGINSNSPNNNIKINNNTITNPPS